MADCKYYGRGACPAMSAARDLINNHSDEARVYRSETSDARLSGAVIAHDTFFEIYCKNEGKDCSVRSHLDRCRK